MKATIIKVDGKVSLARIDKRGRLTWMAGKWLPALSADETDKWLRKNVVKIIEDDGKMYKRGIRHI